MEQRGGLESASAEELGGEGVTEETVLASGVSTSQCRWGGSFRGSFILALWDILPLEWRR